MIGSNVNKYSRSGDSHHHFSLLTAFKMNIIFDIWKHDTENLLGELQRGDNLSAIDKVINELANTLHEAYKLKAQKQLTNLQSIVECEDVGEVRDSMRQLVDQCLFDHGNKVKKNDIFFKIWEPPHVQLPPVVDYMYMEAERSCHSRKVRVFTKKEAGTYKKLYAQLPPTNSEQTRKAAEKCIRGYLTYMEQNKEVVPTEAIFRLPHWFQKTKGWQMVEEFDSSDVVLQEANRIRVAKEDGKRYRCNVFTFAIAQRILQLYECVYGESVIQQLSEHIEATRVTSSECCSSSNESPRRCRKRGLEAPVETLPLKKRPRSQDKHHYECEAERSSVSSNDKGKESSTNENEYQIEKDSSVSEEVVKNVESPLTDKKTGFLSKLVSFW